ncbi:hypothetical protein [Fructobacillus fructosus]|nr:hypothetical protein [Fructobacillus fructosus]
MNCACQRFMNQFESTVNILTALANDFMKCLKAIFSASLDRIDILIAQ